VGGGWAKEDEGSKGERGRGTVVGALKGTSICKEGRLAKAATLSPGLRPKKRNRTRGNKKGSFGVSGCAKRRGKKTNGKDLPRKKSAIRRETPTKETTSRQRYNYYKKKGGTQRGLGRTKKGGGGEVAPGRSQRKRGKKKYEHWGDEGRPESERLVQSRDVKAV